MAPSTSPARVGMHPPVRREHEAAYAEARDNRSLTVGLVGTCIAILTFVLFFLYARWLDGTLNPLLFQWTLLNIVVSLFLFSISSMNFWFVMEALRSDHPDPAKYLRRAERFFGSGWLLLTLAPTLILVTAGLYYAGVIALGFWVVVAAMFFQGWREARGSQAPVRPVADRPRP